MSDTNELITNGIVPLLVAWLTYRQQKHKRDIDVFFAKQRERENGLPWQTQMRRSFRFFRRRRR